ncbi:glycosyltransferase family 39 protein [Terrabacter sp. Soil810]|uniref:glycosyltransferase family 39 protein n=1 Tax=Terrabacter sp. Soil810 TaxID=1736418 RepID=UPI000710CFC5|nr:glycosyltransferase family 39 protein [Terrabacter sp. Soil810]KRF46773.1 hypothetical protein ASG96_01715 [Terrabacter sp. Soil810]
MSDGPAFPPVGRRDGLLVVAIIALGTAIRLPQLGHLLYESHAFRQTQTALVIREYSRFGIDLLSTPLPVFGAGADVPFELPLFQALAALLTHTGLSVDMSARLLGLTFFQLSTLLLWVLVRRWHSIRAAHVALALMQFLPFALAWGAAALIEFMAVAFGLAMVVALDTYLRRGTRVHLAVGAVAAWTCALVKVTTLVPWAVLLVFAALSLARTRQAVFRSAAAAILGPGLGLLLATTWSRYADSIKASEAATRFLTSTELVDWNFGTIESRLSLTSNKGLAYHALLEVGGPVGLGLVLALVGAFLGVGTAWHRAGLLMTVVAGPLVLFNLYAIHSYYWIASFPALTCLMALGILAAVERLTMGAPALPGVTALLTGVVIMVAAVVPLGSDEVSQFKHSNTVPSLPARVAEQTGPDDQLLVIGCDWDPTLLYGADRTGFMIRNDTADALPPQSSMHTYTHLVSCDPRLDPADYLPAGWQATPTADRQIYTIGRKDE